MKSLNLLKNINFRIYPLSFDVRKKKMNKQIRANLKSKPVSTILDSISRHRYVFMSLNMLSLSLLDWFLIRPKQKKKNSKLEKGKEGKLP